MATPKKSPEIDKRILELRKEGLVIREIKEKMFEELQESVSMGYISNVCRNIKNVSDKIDDGLLELDKAIVQSKPYEVANGFYIFYKEGTPYPISVEMVDNIFKDYSRHGSDMTGQQVQIKYKLKPDTWNLLKSRLRLYKDSNIISPHTLERLTPDEQERYIEDNIDESIQDKYRATFQRKHKSIKEREFRKYSNYYYKQQLFLKELEKVLKLYDPRELEKHDLAKIAEPTNNDIIDVAFSDLHMGKKGTDGIVTRIYKMTKYLLTREETHINLLFLGDLIESLAPGGMHPEQEKNMEIHGFDLLMLTVKTLENMLIELYKGGKKVVFYGIGGNHDRIAQNNDDDNERTAALVIYEMISRGVSNTDIIVNILRENINTLYLDNFNYVTMHGSKNDSKKAHSKPESFLRNHIKKNRDKETIILHGDKHHIDMDECKDATIVGVPAMAGEGEFDKKLDVHSSPGYVVIEKNEDDKPDVLIKRTK